MSDRSSGVREVCAMTVPTHAEFNQMAEANARLMAASPDLLKACKAMDAELMFLAAQGRAREKPSLDVISMLRAAIAKAEGGAA
jgi:hypothetical protein